MHHLKQRFLAEKKRDNKLSCYYCIYYILLYNCAKLLLLYLLYFICCYILYLTVVKSAADYKAWNYPKLLN